MLDLLLLYVVLQVFNLPNIVSSRMLGSAYFFRLFSSKMKFGSIYEEYLRAEQDKYLAKCSHVEYKRLKKVLKRCRLDRSLQADGTNGDQQEDRSDESSDACDCNSCTCMLSL